MPFESEHSCRLEDPDEYDDFRRETDAVEVAGRMVDHLYGIRGDVDADLQAVRYPLENGWDTEAALVDAREHCEDAGGIEFEPAEGYASATAGACATCGTRDHAMTEATTPDRTVKTVRADGVVEREVDGESRELLRVPISSTRPDRENDEFSRDALEAMADQIRDEQPMVFDNHGLAGGFMDAIPYDARETIGAQVDAEVEDAGDGEADLFAFVNPDGTHDEGERMLSQVRDEGQPIKFSVGFGIKGYEEKEDDQGNTVGRVFTDVDHMETSRVGIPANPDASVSAAMSAKNNGTAGAGSMLPGYRMHPAFAAMQGRAGEAVATKAAPDGGDPDGGVGEAADDLPDPSDAERVLRTRETFTSVVDAHGPGDVYDGVKEYLEWATSQDDGEDVTVEDALDVLADADLDDQPLLVENLRDLLPEEADAAGEPTAPTCEACEERAIVDEDLGLCEPCAEERMAEFRSALGDGPGEPETGDPSTAAADDLPGDESDGGEEAAEESTDDQRGADHHHITDL